jgi:hypothetical protein
MTADLVAWLGTQLPSVIVLPGPKLEEIPDTLCLVTRVPSRGFTMEGVGEEQMYLLRTRPAAFDPDGGEALATLVDDTIIQQQTAGLFIGMSRVVSIDRLGTPVPLVNDDGERINWVCTYVFEVIR